MAKTYALEGDRMFPRENGRWVHRTDHETLLARCETVERRLAEMELDATRYRWLRANDCTIEYDNYWREALNSAAPPEQLDSAVDAMIAADSVLQG